MWHVLDRCNLVMKKNNFLFKFIHFMDKKRQAFIENCLIYTILIWIMLFFLNFITSKSRIKAPLHVDNGVFDREIITIHDHF